MKRVINGNFARSLVLIGVIAAPIIASAEDEGKNDTKNELGFMGGGGRGQVESRSLITLSLNSSFGETAGAMNFLIPTIDLGYSYRFTRQLELGVTLESPTILVLGDRYPNSEMSIAGYIFVRGNFPFSDSGLNEFFIQGGPVLGALLPYDFHHLRAFMGGIAAKFGYSRWINSINGTRFNIGIEGQYGLAPIKDETYNFGSFGLFLGFDFAL